MFTYENKLFNELFRCYLKALRLPVVKQVTMTSALTQALVLSNLIGLLDTSAGDVFMELQVQALVAWDECSKSASEADKPLITYVRSMFSQLPSF